jgi:hypothetical protein
VQKAAIAVGAVFLLVGVLGFIPGEQQAPPPRASRSRALPSRTRGTRSEAETTGMPAEVEAMALRD